MFKNMRNRMWLLGIARHELTVAMKATGTATLNRVMKSFEADMRTERAWPFESPEMLAIYFNGWMAKQTPLPLAPEVRNFGQPPPGEPREAHHSTPPSQAEPVDQVRGVANLMEVMHIARSALAKGSPVIALMEVEARSSAFVNSPVSPATRRDFLRLREQLRNRVRADFGPTGPPPEPEEDVVSALIERCENFHTHGARGKSFARWRETPEFKLLLVVANVASARAAGLTDEEAVAQVLESRSTPAVVRGTPLPTLEAVANRLTQSYQSFPAEHAAFVLKFARDIYASHTRAPDTSLDRGE